MLAKLNESKIPFELVAILSIEIHFFLMFFDNF